MNAYTVALVGEPEEFVYSLMNYINRREEIPLFALIFSDKASLCAYMEKHKISLVVMCGDTEAVTWLDGIKLPCLRIVGHKNEKKQGTEHNADKGDDNLEKEGSVKSVSMYAMAREQINAMLQMISKVEPMVQGSEHVEVVALYSPVGRCGQTALCGRICSQEYKKGNDILYLGFEEYGQGRPGEGMEEVLYLIKERMENITLRIKALREPDMEYDAILSANGYLDIRELDYGDMLWFVNKLKQEGGYNRIIVDVGRGSLGDLSLLKVMDSIIVPIPQEKESQAKYRQFLQYLDRIGLLEELNVKSYVWAQGLIKTENILEEIRKKGRNLKEA